MKISSQFLDRWWAWSNAGFVAAAILAGFSVYLDIGWMPAALLAVLSGTLVSVGNLFQKSFEFVCYAVFPILLAIPIVLVFNDPGEGRPVIPDTISSFPWHLALVLPLQLSGLIIREGVFRALGSEEGKTLFR